RDCRRHSDRNDRGILRRLRSLRLQGRDRAAPADRHAAASPLRHLRLDAAEEGVAMSTSTNSHRANLIGLALLIALQIVVGIFATNAYYLTTATLCMIFGMASVGLTVVMGYAGLISLGQSAFFGIGAYVAAGLATKYGIEPVAALVLAA